MSPLAVVSRTPYRSLYLFVWLLVAAAGVARAQEAPPPAYIAFVEGTATLEREGEVTPAVLNMPVIPGDRVRTGAGRVEIRFPDGTGIEVGADSLVEMLTPTRVRLLAGTLDRLEPLGGNAASASYLPQDLQMYGSTLDRYGSWRYAPDYGYVWYPMVAPDWRPYHYGYWDPVPSYGWTWIGADVWAWPTHHYGRWGFARSAWFWIPDRTFGAAWVSWGSAPGYVSWCPLGFNNRPVFALSNGYGNPWSGWTVLPRTHFGGRGYYAQRYAVEPRHIPRNTVFVAQSTPPVAVPRHVSNGAPIGTGVAVPRSGAGLRQWPFNSQSTVNSQQSTVTGQQPIAPVPQSSIDRQRGRDRWPATSDQRQTNPYRVAVPRGGSSVTERQPATASQPAPVVTLPPQVYGQPTRAGAWSSQPQQPRTNEPRPATPDYRPPTSGYRPPATGYRPPTSDYRPPANDYRVAVPRAGAAAPAAPAQAAPPQAAPPRSAPSGGPGSHDRAGSTAQPRGGESGGGQSGGASQSGGGQSGGARRRG
jgi:hypothetical protein